MNETRSLVIRGNKIFEDSHGHICLDDLWRAAKAKPSKEPPRWRVTQGAKALIEELQKKIVISGLKENRPDIPVIYALRGRGRSGTFAHPILAAAYAGYLSPKLELEVREVWLRYRKGDVTLADEILQRASAEENKWAGLRAIARSRRVSYTGTLKDHGVGGKATWSVPKRSMWGFSVENPISFGCSAVYPRRRIYAITWTKTNWRLSRLLKPYHQSGL
jgi:hypothetical protein